MNPTVMLLLHHWRRTRLWLILPLMVSALWTISHGSDIWRSRSLDSAWEHLQISVAGNVVILAAGTLILIVAMASGESTAAFPRYAHALPVSDRRWSFSYVLYSLLVFTAFAGAVTLFNAHVWNHAVAVNSPRIAAATQRANEAARQKSLKNLPQPATPQGLNAGEAVGQAFRARAQANPLARRGPVPDTRFQPWKFQNRWHELLLIVSVVFFTQSLFVALSLIQRVPVRVFTVAAALVLTPAAGLLIFFNTLVSRPWAIWIFFRYFWPLIVIMLGAAIMHLAARRERHGGSFLQRATEIFASQVGDPQLGFATARHALAWYDWMTFGRYVIYGAVGVAIAMTPIYGINGNLEISGVSLLPVCGLAGIYLAYRLYYGDRQDNDAYLLTLPITVERLSKSRLINTTRLVAAAFVFVILLEAFIMFAVYPLYEQFPTAKLSSFVLFAPFSAWALIWLAGPLFYPFIAGWLLALGIAGFLQWFFLPQIPFEELTGFVGAGMACVFALAATVWLFRAAKRRGLLFKWNKRLAVAAWVVAAALTVPIFLEESHGEATLAMLIMPLFLCLLPAAPFLALPLAIDRYRHR